MTEVTSGGWAQFFSELVKQFPGLTSGANNQFQFAAAPMEASWNENSDFNSYIMSDREPSDAGGWYTPATTDISQDYGTFLNNVRMGTAPSDPAYNTVATQLANANSALINATTDARNAFKAWLNNNPDHLSTDPDIKTTAAFLASSDGAGFKSKIDAALLSVNTYQAEIARWQAQQMKPLTDALTAYNDKQNNWHSGVMPDSGGPIVIPNGSITPSLGTDIAAWDTGKKNFSPITITKQTQVSNHWQVSGSFNASYSAGFIGAYVSGSRTDTEDVYQDNKFSLTIDAAGVKLYTINRGNWFNGGVLATYKGGPFYDSRLSSATFFSLAGTLKLIPSAVLVIYKPNCSLTVSRSTYSRYETAWTAGGGIRIGPFSFGGSASSDTVHATQTGDSMTVTFAPTDDQPLIVGVLSDLHLYA